MTELFEDFSEPRQPKLRFRKKFWPQQKMTLVLPYERAIFGLIALIMVLLIAFALGMERGRHTYGYIARESPIKIEHAPIELVTEKKEEKLGFFTIQVATFTKQDLAQLEKERLIKGGFDASLAKSDKYIQICVGHFKSKKDAEGELKRLKAMYKDCYIRFRKE